MTLPKECTESGNPVGCEAIRPIVNPSANAADNRLSSSDGYVFDPAGNTVRDPQSRRFTYDGENKQVMVETLDLNGNPVSTVGEYEYDGDGKRVKKHVPSTGEVTVFVYDAGGKLIGEYSTVAAPQSPKVSYTTADHLGSPRILTDENGATISRRDFMPYGEEIARTAYGTDTVRQNFTGYERDEETGLDFAQARTYRSEIGRYTSVDPIILTRERPLDPQQLGLYSYVRNNPYRFVDPSGEVYEFSSKDAEERFKKYKEFLEKCGERCAKELKTLNRLHESKITYVINLKSGKEQSASGEGELTTDGEKIFVNIDNIGGPDGETYSLNSRFAHELEHGRQFEDGELAFRYDERAGRWVAAAYDLTDEVKAHEAMLSVATASDYTNDRRSRGTFRKTLLGDFRSARNDEARLGVIRASNYGQRGKNLQEGPVNFNPAGAIAGEKKPGELVQTSQWFGRIHK